MRYLCSSRLGISQCFQNSLCFPYSYRLYFLASEMSGFFKDVSIYRFWRFIYFSMPFSVSWIFQEVYSIRRNLAGYVRVKSCFAAVLEYASDVLGHLLSQDYTLTPRCPLDTLSSFVDGFFIQTANNPVERWSLC